MASSAGSTSAGGASCSGALARLEAEIDFAADEDVPADLLSAVRPVLGKAVCRNRGPCRRCAPRRAAARRPDDRRDRPAECRQVEPGQPPGAARRRDRDAGARHHPRRARGPSRPRRLSGHAARHGRPARAADDVEAEGRAPGAAARRRGRSAPAAVRRRALAGARCRDPGAGRRGHAGCVVNKADLGRLAGDLVVAGRPALRAVVPDRRGPRPPARGARRAGGRSGWRPAMRRC